MQGYLEEPPKERLEAELRQHYENPRDDLEVFKDLAFWNKEFLKRASRAEGLIQLAEEAVRQRKDAEKHIEYCLKELDQNERLRGE